MKAIKRKQLGTVWLTRRWTELEYSIHTEEPSGDEYAETHIFTDCYEEGDKVFGYSYTGVFVTLVDYVL